MGVCNPPCKGFQLRGRGGPRLHLPTGAAEGNAADGGDGGGGGGGEVGAAAEEGEERCAECGMNASAHEVVREEELFTDKTEGLAAQ